MSKKIITEINIYPIKSLGGVSLSEAVIESRGLRFDRRWMLVDSDGKFMTQRVFSQMALLKADLTGDELIITHKQKKSEEPLRIELNKYNKEELIDVTIWDDALKANTVSEEADEWFTKVLSKSCRLVYMSDETIRRVDEKYATGNQIVGFADEFPFLLIGEESLKDLNSRLKEKLPMNRFRTNFVFSGGDAFEEDRWKRFRAGTAIFNVAKPCARCVITTTDQETGIRGAEPLSMLASYRNVNGKVLFGQNLTHDTTGKIKVGDEIEVLEWK